jgi:hypothetical protein
MFIAKYLEKYFISLTYLAPSKPWHLFKNVFLYTTTTIPTRQFQFLWKASLPSSPFRPTFRNRCTSCFTHYPYGTHTQPRKERQAGKFSLTANSFTLPTTQCPSCTFKDPHGHRKISIPGHPQNNHNHLLHLNNQPTQSILEVLKPQT